MDFLIIMGFFLFVIWVVTRLDPASRRPQSKPTACPPHTWKWHDQPGGGHYIQCTTCHRFPNLETRDDPPK